MWIRGFIVYQNLGDEKLLIDFKNLVNNAKDYVETLDTEFVKFKMLSVSGNN